MRSLVGVRDARAAVDDADEQPAAAHPRADGDRLARRVARGVLEQVRERALELRGVGEDQRQVAVDRELDALGATPADVTASRSSSSIEHQSRRGSARARLQARELEQLVDQAREPRALRA